MSEIGRVATPQGGGAGELQAWENGQYVVVERSAEAAMAFILSLMKPPTGNAFTDSAHSRYHWKDLSQLSKWRAMPKDKKLSYEENGELRWVSAEKAIENGAGWMTFPNFVLKTPPGQPPESR